MRHDRLPKQWLAHCLGFLLLLLCGMALSENFQLSRKIIAQVESRFGIEAKGRVEAWRQLILSNQAIAERDKLNKVNEFFNELHFVSDLHHWGKSDYWATPIEFIATKGGDCEDFSIAKYFTLRAMGVPDERMRLTYVKSLSLNQAHMVLTYFASPTQEPLILDNLMSAIRPSSMRSDLLPVYSFNGDGLWIAKQRGAGKRVGNAGRISLWRELIARMQNLSLDPVQDLDQGMQRKAKGHEKAQHSNVCEHFECTFNMVVHPSARS